MMKDCDHNNRMRFTDGFHCSDCQTYFPKDSPTYRRDELLNSIELVLWNIHVDLRRAFGAETSDALEMSNKVRHGYSRDGYEDLIAEAEVIMRKYGKTCESATVVLH